MTWHEVEVEGPVGTTPVVARLVERPTTRIVLVRDEDGRLHATAPRCPHLGQPLSLGHVDGDVLECSHHAYRYRLSDGVCVGPGGPLAGRLAVHEVRERPEGVEVRLAGAGRAPTP